MNTLAIEGPRVEEAGYVSSVELERLTKDLMLQATLHNRITDAIKHRKVHMAYFYLPDKELVYGVKNAPEYAFVEGTSLYSLQTTTIGKVLSVMA